MAPNEWKCGVVNDDEDDKYKLNEEISYGISLRKSRNQEKQILLAQDQYSIHSSVKEKVPPFSRPAKRFKRKTRKIIRRNKANCISLLPKEETVTRILDRFSCTRKEHIDLLATPKREFFPEQLKCKQSVLHPASPRFAQLALPHKKFAFHTWYNFHRFLKPEQIITLQQYLSKEEALDPKDAQDYFKRLDKKKKAEKKLRKRKQREKELVKKPQKSKLYREINRLAKMIVKHFAEKQQQAVKCVHVMLTDLMKHHLEKENCIPCCCKRNRDKDVYSKTLFDALDQLSVWLESNVSYDNLMIDSDEEEIEEEEKELSFSESEEEGSSGESDYIYKSEMEEYDRKKMDQQMGMTMDKMGKGEDQLLSEYDQFAHGQEEGKQFTLRGKLLEDEYLKMVPGAGEAEDTKAKKKAQINKIGKMIEFEGRSAPQESVSESEFIIHDEMDLEPGDVLVSTERDLPEEVFRQIVPAPEEKPTGQPTIEEHSPDAVCCVTIKTWTKWLVDVSHNTHHWCQWIQDVIARVRFFAAVIKREVTMPDGRKRVLHKEEWDHFTETLDKDIEAWHQYNKHVKEISENIINEFQNKRIICCPACLKSKLIIDEESAHQVTDQLVQALNTTSYWRSWLDTIVTEAQKLKDLSFALSPSTGEDDSGSSSLGYFELVELKTPSPEVTTISSSEDGSLFVLLEIEKEKDEKPPENPK